MNKNVIWNDIIHRYCKHPHTPRNTNRLWGNIRQVCDERYASTAISHHTGSGMCVKKEIHIGKQRKRETHTYKGILVRCVHSVGNVTNTLTRAHTPKIRRKWWTNTVVKSNTSCYTHVRIHWTLTYIASFDVSKLINWKFETARKSTFSVFSKCHANKVGGRAKYTCEMSQTVWKLNQKFELTIQTLWTECLIHSQNWMTLKI